MLVEPLRNPFVDPALSIENVAAFGGTPDDALKAHPWPNRGFVIAVQHLPIAGVAKNKLVLGVVVSKPLRDAFDGFGKTLVAALTLELGLFQRRDVIKPR